MRSNFRESFLEPVVLRYLWTAPSLLFSAVVPLPEPWATLS